MTLSQIERRLATLEQKVAAISRSGDHPIGSNDVNAWIDEIHGTFNDDASYRKAARLGRRWRKGQRPANTRKAGAG